MKRKCVLLLYVIVCVLLLVTSTKEDEFVPYYEERREVVLRVESMPDIRGEGTFYVCKVVNIAQNISNFSTNIRLFVKGDGGMYQYGDLLQTIIIFEQPDVATNPGNFNYKNYLLSLNITATATVSSQSDIQCIGNQPANVIVLCGMQCRKAILKLLQTCMPHGSSALIEAMFLGNKEQRWYASEIMKIYLEYLSL